MNTQATTHHTLTDSPVRKVLLGAVGGVVAGTVLGAVAFALYWFVGRRDDEE